MTAWQGSAWPTAAIADRPAEQRTTRRRSEKLLGSIRQRAARTHIDAEIAPYRTAGLQRDVNQRAVGERARKPDAGLERDADALRRQFTH